MSQKGRGKGKGPEVVFDDKARAEYLTGFRKRKQERKQAGRDYLAKKAKEEQLATRKELRNARKEKAAENVREQRKAFGLDAEGESDLDQAAAADSDGGQDIDDEDAVPQIHQEEYDSDQHHTHVVVESFDPEQEAFEKATAITTTSTRTPKAAKSASASAATAALSSVEALPPSSRRINKAKANASLSLSPFSSIEPPPRPFFSTPCSHPYGRYTDITSPPSSLPQTTGQGQETDHPHQEENVTTKRLHISGLTASFSQEDLERRFSTFGTVIALDGLGKLDALGQFRPFAYLTLQAPPQQIKRCMNVLSGSVWKGATLRIGEAKPDYQQRVQLENDKRRQKEEEEKANNPKKAKRLPPGMGLESGNMEPIDQEAVEAGLAWGWKRTPAGHLVRPLRMRPSHPLPRPSHASTLSRVGIFESNKGEEEEQQQQEDSTSSRRARVNPRPPKKAHRITIDPTRYGAIHLSGPLLESLAAGDALDTSSLGPGEWHCEEIDHDDEDEADEKDHRLVCWRYTANDGRVLHEEFTKIPVRVVAKSSSYVPAARANASHAGEEDVMAQLDFDQYSSAGSDEDLFSGFASSIAPAPQQIESKAPAVTSRSAPSAINQNAVDTADIDDLFAGLGSTSSAAAATNINDLFSDLPSVAATPAPPSKRVKVAEVAATPTLSKSIKGTFVPGLDPEEDDPANFSDGYDEVAAVGPSQSSKQMVDAEEERKKTLALLGEMFGSGSDDDVPSSEAAQAVVEADEEEVDSSSESESESGLASSSESEAASADGSSSSSDEELSVSSSELKMAIDEEDPIVEEEQQEQDVSMADAPFASVDAVAAAPAMDAKSRRAAFLLSLSDPASSERAAQSSSVIARFDPGTRATSPPPAPTTDGTPVAAALQPESTPSQPAPAAQSAIQDDTSGPKVSMSTLKEMFKPQDRASTSGVTAGFSLGLGGDASSGVAENGGGFSLMDSLGLEFELEEDEPEFDKQPVPTIPSRWGNTSQPTFSTPSSTVEQPTKLAPFFPSSSSSTTSWNSSNQGSVQRWLKPRSQDEKESDWTKYKESLTQVIKKRHREAARKHKRGFKSLPKPQPTAAAGVGMNAS